MQNNQKSYKNPERESNPQPTAQKPELSTELIILSHIDLFSKKS